MPHGFWLYRTLGREIVKADIAAGEGRVPTEDELDARQTEDAYNLLGQSWCQANQGQLHLLSNAAAKAGQLGSNELQFGLAYIRRVGPGILTPLQDTAPGAYLLSYLAGTAGEGNREQFYTLFLGSLIRIGTGE